MVKKENYSIASHSGVIAKSDKASLTWLAKISLVCAVGVLPFNSLRAQQSPITPLAVRPIPVEASVLSGRVYIKQGIKLTAASGINIERYQFGSDQVVQALTTDGSGAFSFGVQPENSKWTLVAKQGEQILLVSNVTLRSNAKPLILIISAAPQKKN